MTMKTFTATAVLASLLGFAAPMQASAQSLTATNANVIAYSEGPVPGLPPEEYFAYNFSWPLLSEDDSVVFLAQMEGGSITPAFSYAYFKATTASDLTMVTRLSDPAPGLPGLLLRNNTGNGGFSSNFPRSPDGRTLWMSSLFGPGVTSTNDTALFAGPPESPVLVAREGSPAPGTLGAVYSGNADPNGQFATINRNGTVLFRSALSGGDTTTANNAAVFYGQIGALGILYRKGEVMLPGIVAASVADYTFKMDNDGRVLFGTLLAGAGVTPANDFSLWLYTPGSGRTLLLREGGSAPGTAGATFQNAQNNWAPSSSPSSLTRTGKYVFATDLVGGDAVPGVNDRALYLASTSGALTLISRSGDPAPGTDGVFFGFSHFFCQVNDSGRVLVQAQITGGTVDAPNDSGYWTAAPGGPLVKLARAGDPAPGTDGAVFDGLIAWQDYMNDLSQVVFQANLLGGDVVGGVNDHALYAWDPVNGLWLLARGGEEIPVGQAGPPDTFIYPWAFSSLQFSNTDGQSLTLGKDGVFAMRMHLVPQGQAIATVDLKCYPPSNAWADADGDGYGDPGSTPVSVCANAAPPSGYVANTSDCDDTSPDRHPGASDVNCDGIDDNCNGTADEGYAPHATSCGTGACARTGSATCVGGVESNSCTPGAPTAETCNGIDDNCDGTVDNAPVPTGTPGLSVSRLGGSTAHLTWTAVSSATGYDVVQGSLQVLASSHGGFSASTSGCLGNDLAATTIDDPGAPAAGQGTWYVLRAMSCGGSASYNSGAPSQTGSRDAGIAASGHACP